MSRDVTSLEVRPTIAAPLLQKRDALSRITPSVPDTTYLGSPIQGSFFDLDLALDIWSRRIAGWTIETSQSPAHPSRFLAKARAREGVGPEQLVIHADDGGPMKGSTRLATLQTLGVTTSLRRPNVSNDNPFSESLFETLKERTASPDVPSQAIEDACSWTEGFGRRYDTEHRHSGIRFVTPMERHGGFDIVILKRRDFLCAAARAAHRERRSRSTRNRSAIPEVVLHPAPAETGASAT